MPAEQQPTPMFNGDDLLTVSEVAKHLRVDGTTVRRWIKSGVLQAVTLPQRGSRPVYRVRRSTLERVVGDSSSIAS